ncbi:MAG: hypothetical protein O3C48_08140 [Crenarchaeota archaeon]|nr:hypothetical protein [Thermoproteota archaeon]
MVDHQTEKQFENALNGKNFSDLSPKLQNFVKCLNDNIVPDNNCVIIAKVDTKNVPSSQQHIDDFPDDMKRHTMRPKRDAIVSIGEKIKKITLKSGSGNSYHQEEWKYFSVLLKNLNANTSELNAFENFIHSRDTNYFKEIGEPCKLYGFTESHEEFYNSHDKERSIMQSFLNKNRKKMITHFIKTGYCSEIGFADYVFHGDKNDILSHSVFANVDYIIEKIFNTITTSANLSVGSLTFQRWNVCPKNEKKLNTVQCKGASITKFM